MSADALISPSRGRILIVDDDRANLRLLERTLSNAGLRDVRTTSDPRDVLPLCEEIVPDLLMLDLHMPHMDGMAVTKEVRAHFPAEEYLPILMLTGDTSEQTKQRALSSGATDFLAKPFSRRSAPLHDAGKVAIPDSILLKPGPLTESEFEIIKTHTTVGASILSGGSSAVMRTAESIALSHHEQWDGRGYPHGISGDQIPLAAQITSVADVFDALSHARPYREAWPVARVMEEIRASAGTKFSPAVAEAFLSVDPVV